MKKKLINNLGLKILALLFSFVLWLIVVNINDPIKTVTYSGIKVEVINEEAITSQGKVYEVLENTGTVTVSVTANRSVFDSISSENIRAVADMKEISFMDTVRINAYCNRGADNIESIKSNTENLKLNIEDVKKIQLVITPVAVGTPANDYVLGDITTNQNIVRISGPESVVSEISKAVVTVDVGGMTSSINTSADLKLYDTEDNLITNSSITKNIDEVSVNAQILATKEVPINCLLADDLAVGYMLTGEVTADPHTIRIAGSKKNLEAVKQIDIPETAFETAGRTTDLDQTIEIKKYLPEGIALADSSFNGKVKVTASVGKTFSKNVEIPKYNIAITNVPEGMTAKIVDVEEVLPATINGLKDTVDLISGDNIRGVLDIGLYMEKMSTESLEEGIYQVEVTLELPEGTELANDLNVTISLENSQ